MNAEIGQPYTRFLKGHVISQMFEKEYVCRPPFAENKNKQRYPVSYITLNKMCYLQFEEKCFVHDIFSFFSLS